MSKDNLAVKLRKNIGGKIVDPACKVLTNKQNVYFIVDTTDNDAEFLQESLLKNFETSLGVPYVVSFADIGSKTTLVQDLLSMIFLKTHFLEDLLHTKCNNKKEVFRKLSKETNISFLEAVQRFLECKKLTRSQKEILTFEEDLSDYENAVDFFIQCLSSYQQYFKKRPVFYFKDIVFTRESITASLTASFFAKLKVEIPCVMLFKVKKSAEYTVLPLEREFCVIRLATVECSTLIQFVPQLWTLTKGTTDAFKAKFVVGLHLTNEQRCRLMDNTLERLKQNRVKDDERVLVVFSVDPFDEVMPFGVGYDAYLGNR